MMVALPYNPPLKQIGRFLLDPAPSDTPQVLSHFTSQEKDRFCKVLDSHHVHLRGDSDGETGKDRKWKWKWKDRICKALDSHHVHQDHYAHQTIIIIMFTSGGIPMVLPVTVAHQTIK